MRRYRRTLHHKIAELSIFKFGSDRLRVPFENPRLRELDLSVHQGSIIVKVVDWSYQSTHLINFYNNRDANTIMAC